MAGTAGRRLGRCAPDVLGSRTLRPFADVEFDAVALAKIVDSLPIDCTPVGEILLAPLGLKNPKPLSTLSVRIVPVTSVCLPCHCPRGRAQDLAAFRGGDR